MAEGTYKPDATGSNPSGTGDRFATFQLINGVILKGGYAGLGEPDPNARDLYAYQTVLSGDIGTVGVNTDNSHHVVTGSGTDATAILEGFTITGGYATDGGGMYNSQSSPTVTNCTFSGNQANYGGGMFNEYSSPTVTDCNFTGNSAEMEGGGMYNYDNSSPMVTNCSFNGNEATYNGGGMLNIAGSSPTLADCTFISNTANWDGGGMYNHNGSSPTVTDCNFTGNSAGMEGGGMYNREYSSPIVTNCNFTGNTADAGGGGMYNREYSSPTVTNCTFSGNVANGNTGDADGGGMYNFNNSNPTLTNCTFSGNYAAWEGGGMRNSISSPTITNCIFSNNTTPRDGGGMRNHQCSPILTNCIFSNNTANWGGAIYNLQSNTTFTNCTFSGNEANTQGGVMNNYNYSKPLLTNCILWGNTPDQIVDQDYFTSKTTVSFSDVQGGWGGAGNINAEPCFVDPNNPDPNLVNLRLLPDSPCIDKGSNNAPNLPPTDLAGNRRIFDGDGNGSFIVDMGAYEFGSLNLLAHWKLDESFGSMASDSSGDNHGTLEPGPPVWQPAGGQVDGALQLDGVDDYVDCGNDERLNITDAITLSVWVNTNDAGNGQFNPYVTKGDQSYAIKHRDNNYIEFCIYDSGWHTVWSPVDSSFNGAWHHLAGTYDGSELILYVDGVLAANSLHTGSINGSTFNVNIGRNAEITDRFYDGLIDDVAIFSRALNGTDINNLMNNGGASFIGDPNLEALWELDESSGTIAHDSSGNGIDGSLEPTSPLWQPAGGQLDGALEFDGWNDCVFIPNESRFDITYQVTVSAWIKVKEFDKDWQAIVTKGDSAWRLHRLRDTNSIAFHCNLYPDDWGANGSVNVNNGQWHHVAGVYDGTRAYLYVDGVLDGSEAAFGLIGTNNYPVMIGENAEQTGRFWNGLIDDVRIYACALGPAEVYQLYSTICYVDADAAGNNDGSSWADAFNYLQDALAQAAVGWEIRVAEGTYKPDANSSNPTGTGDRFATFHLINRAILKGGYAGAGTPDPNDRDVDAYLTVLSGDIGLKGNNYDNCFHVVTSIECNPNTVLDGFTITGGNANYTYGYPHDCGGGMHNREGSSPMVTNCTFNGNSADYGGGMFNSFSSPTVTNCTFSENRSRIWGAGMYNGESSPTVTNCTFSENRSTQRGGGIFNSVSSPTVTKCIISNNSASYGGGMYNYSNSHTKMTNCTFISNYANVIGGGMYNLDDSSPTVTNCTFSGNSAGNYGGGMHNRNGSNPTVTNCVLWHNLPDQINDWESSSLSTVTYSDVQGGWPDANNNIDADPYFVDAEAGNLRLRPGSPCIDVGNNSEPNLPPTDLDGRPRIIDGDCDGIDVVDMGAYEFAFAYVGDFDNNCTVNFFDVSILARAWETEEGDPDWNWACDISYPPDNYIDWRDVAILCNNWLAGAGSK